MHHINSGKPQITSKSLLCGMTCFTREGCRSYHHLCTYVDVLLKSMKITEMPTHTDDAILKIIMVDAGLDKCKEVAADLDNQRPVILFNPRLARYCTLKSIQASREPVTSNSRPHHLLSFASVGLTCKKCSHRCSSHRTLIILGP